MKSSRPRISGRKSRLDDRLVEMGVVKDRRQAVALLLTGRVKLLERPVTKPGTLMTPEDSVSIDSVSRYVSRGGLKLEPALAEWAIAVQDRVCLDIGASTGGFTDCLLQHGARRVYALDVGKGQLDWTLRNDTRVKVLEGLNARNLKAEYFEEPPSLVTIDVSFISVTQILPTLLSMRPFEAVVLVKPQFEAIREEVPPGGVIRDAELRARIVKRVKEVILQLGFHVLAEDPSKVKGRKGNQEFLFHLNI